MESNRRMDEQRFLQILAFCQLTAFYSTANRYLNIIQAKIRPKPFGNWDKATPILPLFLSAWLPIHNPLMTPLIAQTQPPTLNLVFFGDSLTEGVPHFNGETDTMPFMVNQQFPGATYIKLGYRSQTSGYLREKFDGWLCAQYKAGMENVLVLWTGTNDLALNTTNVVPQVCANMVALAQAARSAVGTWWL